MANEPWLHYLNEIGVFGIPNGHNCVNFFDQLLLLVVIKVHVPFGQTGFPCPILDEYEPDLWRGSISSRTLLLLIDSPSCLMIGMAQRGTKSAADTD